MVGRLRVRSAQAPRIRNGHIQPQHRQFRVGTAFSGETDAVENDEKCHLLLELADAKAEVLQLRNALRYTAGQELPMIDPDTFYRETISKLEQRLHDRDEQLRKLGGDSAATARQALIHKHGILAAIERWSGFAGLDYAREAWRAWADIIRDARQAKRLKTALVQGQAKNSQRARKVLQLLTAGNIMLEARVILSRWRAVSAESKAESARETRRQQALYFLTGRISRAELGILMAAWRRAIEERLKAEQQAEFEKKLRMAPVKATRELKLALLQKSVLAMTASSEKMEEPMLLKVVVSSWRQSALESKSGKALERRQLLYSESRDRAKAHAYASVAMILSGSSKARLAACFSGWKDAYIMARLDRLHVLRTIWMAWLALQADADRSRAVEREREEMRKERDGHAAVLRRAEKRQHAIIMVFAAADHLFLLESAFSTWRIEWLEAKQLLDEEEKRANWQLEFEALREGLAREQRFRAAADALLGPGSEDILRFYWSRWLECVRGERHFREMDGAQQLFEQRVEEEEKRFAREQHSMERKALDLELQRHVLHARRSDLVALGMRENQKSFKQVIMTTWRGVVHKSTVEEMKRLLREKRLAPSYFSRIGRCFGPRHARDEDVD